MQRRQFLARFTALTAAPWLIGCNESPLQLAIHPWVGYETIFLARDFAWLPASLQFIEGKSASDTLAALETGRADAGCLTLDEVLRARAGGLPLTVALVFDVSAGADVVLASPKVATLADLAGKRIGVEKNALGALVLDRLLQTAGLPVSAVTVVDLAPDRQVAAWKDGRVDALVTYEPAATLVQREGAHLIFDSRQMPDTIFDVLAVRRDRLSSRRAALTSLLTSHFRALRHFRDNRQDAIYRIAAHQGIRPDEVQQALSGITLPSLAANRSYLAAQDSRLTRAAGSLSKLMRQQGLLARQDELKDLFAPDWLPHDDV